MEKQIITFTKQEAVECIEEMALMQIHRRLNEFFTTDKLFQDDEAHKIFSELRKFITEIPTEENIEFEGD